MRRASTSQQQSDDIAYYDVDDAVPAAFQALYLPYRFKGYYGGRGAGRSWNFARALLKRSLELPASRHLCCREYQASIGDSVHHLLASQIYNKPPEGLGLREYFKVTDKSITNVLDSEFVFKGLH